MLGFMFTTFSKPETVSRPVDTQELSVETLLFGTFKINEDVTV